MTILKQNNYYYVCVCVVFICRSVCASCACLVPRPEEGAEFLGTGVIVVKC